MAPPGKKPVMSTDLESTAYTILGEADQATILAAINNEIRTRAETVLRGQRVRQPFPYDAVVEAAISEVFRTNLALFSADSEDDSTVDELLNHEQ
ncbi:hypothetical protein PG985_007507 [Apiospora marii]|uniref:uncharacterized protein n=1 Tax=Apiospora marii TaxID=335849 RepID=UPI00312EB44D